MKYIYLVLFILFTSNLNSEIRELILRKPFEEQFLSNLECLDSNDCYAVLSNTIDVGLSKYWVYRSTNRGRNWQLYIDLITLYYNTIQSFSIVDSLNIYFGMSERNEVLITNDGGKKFKKITFPFNTNETVYLLVMMDSLKGLAYMNAVFYRTFDNWNTFDSIPIDKPTDYIVANRKNDSIIRFISYNYIENIDPKHIRYYSEYNINNNTENLIYKFKKEHIENGEALDIMDMHFVNDSLGFVCGERDIGEVGEASWSLVYKTTDGGKSWRLVLKDIQGERFGLDEICFADEKYGVTTGSWGSLYQTMDEGETWILKETPEEFNSPVTHVEFAGQVAIISELDGNIWTWQYPDDTTGVSVEDLIKSSKLHVIKRSNDLKIAITDPQYRAYRLEIIDIMGRKVTDKSINSNAAGNVYHTINIKNLNKGSYFFALSFNGAVVHTGKFIK